MDKCFIAGSVRCFVGIVVWLLSMVNAMAAEISITELGDLNFGQVPPTAGRLVATTTFCVGLDERSRYQVVANGTSNGGRFTLQAGNRSGIA